MHPLRVGSLPAAAKDPCFDLLLRLTGWRRGQGSGDAGPPGASAGMRRGGEQAGRRVVSALAAERRRRTQLRAFLSRLGSSDMPTHRRLTLLLTATLASPLLVYLAIASARAEAFVTAGLSAIAAATIPSALA